MVSYFHDGSFLGDDYDLGLGDLPGHPKRRLSQVILWIAHVLSTIDTSSADSSLAVVEVSADGLDDFV